MKSLLKIIFFLSCFAVPALAAEEKENLAEYCVQALGNLPGKVKKDALKLGCKEATRLPECASTKGLPIFHVDRRSTGREARRILVFALIHGDEFPSGSVARSWIERLANISPRNNWRIVPVLNPDGVQNKTRYNANGVDINRNFPTKNWENEAMKYWEKDVKKDKRRYPGAKAASEVETRCAMAEIDEYKPDFILSIHTPYGVLDLDGPKIKTPRFSAIPWKSLGTYPGSLGRFMWVDRSRPILTIELQEKGVTDHLETFDRLQDFSSEVAIRSELATKRQKQAKEKQTREVLPQ